MKQIFTLMLISLVVFSIAQEKIDYDAIAKIKEEGLENSQVMDIAFYLTDVSGPRLTGSEGLKNASNWAIKEMKKWGLENVGLEKWGEFGMGWDVKKSYVAMTKPYYAPLIAMPKAWTPGTNGLVSGTVIMVKVENEADLAAYKGQLKDKIIVIGGSDPNTQFIADAKRYSAEELDRIATDEPNISAERIAQWRARRAFARKLSGFLQEEGAALVITGRRGKHGTFFTSNGASYNPDANKAIAELEMAPEHANRMIRLLEAGIEVEIEAQIETVFQKDDLNGYNVIAEIPGTDLKDEVVMLGAHLDSWHAATGATDNASGSAVMMEVMRILKTTGLQPRRTVRLAFWTGEEQGIHGSRQYVKNHFADRATMKLKPEHNKFSAYYNIDNGTGRIRGIYLQGNEAVRRVFEAWFKPFEDMIDQTTITIRDTRGTDHLGFDAVGLPGFQFIQDPIEYSTRTHHTNMDTFERLIEDDLKQMSVIVASFVYHTAIRDQKLPREPLPEPSESQFE